MQPFMLPFFILAFDILRALKLEAVTAQTNDLVRDSEDLRAAYRELRDWHGEHEKSHAN